MQVESGRRWGAVIFFGLVWLLAAGMAPADEKKEEKETTVTEPFGVRVEIPEWKEELAERQLRETGNDILTVLDYRDDKGCGPGSKTYFLRGVKEEHKSCFSKIENGTVKKLEFALDSRPGSGYVLYIYGVQIREGKREPNPDVGAVQLEVERDVEEKEKQRQDEKEKEKEKKAQLGLDEDEYYAYQLSHVQADRALALLKSLGYHVVEFAQEKDKEPNTPFDKIFKKEPTEGVNSRPAIINLIDSVGTSLVGQGSGGGGGEEPDDPLKLGGQKMEEMTTGDPQQRLLIVWQEGEKGKGREDLEKLLRLLREEIDVPSKQILIEALVIELDKDWLREIGVTFEGSKDGRSLEFQESATGLQLPLIATLTRPAAKTVFELTASLKALIDRGEARVLSRPSVLVLDGRQARIQVGDKIPYTSKLDATQAGILAETTYLGVGIVLNLRPRASLDNSEVTMQVETLISSAGPSFVQPGTGVLVAPPIRSREVQTLVRVANDTPFIIGGLISTTYQTDEVGVPGLSDIPLFGRLFRKNLKIDDSKEVIVVITPHVIPMEDRSFAFTIPKDADIFDSFGRELFRNIYRVRSEDVFDLAFIRESAFFNCLAAQVLEHARETTGHLAAKGAGDTGAAGSASPRQNGDQGQAQRVFCPRYRPPSDLAVLVESLEKGDYRPTKAYMSLLKGGVPGEDILVKRMLLGLIEKLHERLSYGVDPQDMIFFEDYSRKSCPDGTEWIPLQDQEREATDAKAKKRKKGRGKPEAAFTFASDGLTVLFTDRSIGVPTRWHWDFGDGQTSTDRHPDHLYSKEGTFSVVLQVGSDLGSATATAEVAVSELPAVDISGLSSRLDKRLSEAACGQSVVLSFEGKWVGIGGVERRGDPGAFERFKSQVEQMQQSLQAVAEQQKKLRDRREQEQEQEQEQVQVQEELDKLIGLTKKIPIPFDPPKAAVCSQSVPRECLEGGRLGWECFQSRLRELNPRGAELDRKDVRILLNECYSRRGFSTLGYLANVLVLKRLLELNPSLPLTIEGFHVGREIVFPTRQELAESKHLVDRAAAQLYYETLDYYQAFAEELRQALRLSGDVSDLVEQFGKELSSSELQPD